MPVWIYIDTSKPVVEFNPLATGVKIHGDPNTGTKEGPGVVTTNPQVECKLVQYTQQSEEEVVTSSRTYVSVGGWVHLVIQGEHRVWSEQWIENTCDPGVKQDYSRVLLQSLPFEWDKALYQSSGLTGVGVPQPIPGTVLNLLTHSPVTSPLEWADQYYVHPDPESPTLQGRKEDQKNDGMGKFFGEGEENETDVELRYYGMDSEKDDDIILNKGPGFNYRDRISARFAGDAAITREELKSAVPYNQYKDIDWESGRIVSATFTPLSTTPSFVEGYRVTYGWWLIRVKARQ